MPQDHPSVHFFFRPSGGAGRCALALCAIGLRSVGGLKEQMGAMNERSPLFSPAPSAPPGFGFAYATQRLRALRNLCGPRTTKARAHES